MATTERIPNIFPVNPSLEPAQQKKPFHNRWHPEIPPVAQVKVNSVFRVEMIDWTGGQIKNNDSAEDMKTVNLTRCHHLSGPFAVLDEQGQPAQPGDLLVIELCDLGALPEHEWGYTGIFDRENGGGFLTDHFPKASKAIWDFEGIYASSRHIPGVRFAGIIHPGIVGTAPSKELLEIWNERERTLVEEGTEKMTLASVLQCRPMALLPEPKYALLGSIDPKNREFNRIASEAARTIPGRENGGNCDIKNLSRGSRVYLPVFVPGANFSIGDLHFSQGDGEVSFCGAIEMSGYAILRCQIIRNGMDRYLSPMGPTKLHVNPIFEVGPLEPRYSEYLVFEGVSVDEQGRQTLFRCICCVQTGSIELHLLLYEIWLFTRASLSIVKLLSL
ncbi:formamidase [Galdieria sulphuraria]|uniref:Formamidase n=1 Tax=Galdieria sulphuraria TaxID=130081 RepID=M2XZL8_GALSU|nr:formamidase [Galdieria sulphuraria]EME29093.1 formamidase [Galdieria sulphuraria]|eukprot:XP_005705613.1 formamidase [Galdieria sulphuraria]